MRGVHARRTHGSVTGPHALGLLILTAMPTVAADDLMAHGAATECTAWVSAMLLPIAIR